MKKLILIISLVILSGAFTSRLKRKYKSSTGFDTFYLEFVNKKSFEMEMYSCTYAMKISGTYRTTKDTIFLTYVNYETRGDNLDEWIKMDSSEFSPGRVRFLSHFNTLIRRNNDNLLLPYGIRRHFEAK